jgi:hypothetical protein
MNIAQMLLNSLSQHSQYLTRTVPNKLNLILAHLSQLLYMEMKSTPTARSTLKMGIHSNTLHFFNVILYLEKKTNAAHKRNI